MSKRSFSSCPRREGALLPLGLIYGGQLVGGRREHFYGNYNMYYGSRRNEDTKSEMDKRLQGLVRRDPSLFCGKRILDVGCNEGLVTFALSGALGARSVVGIDIDVLLIDKALSTLRLLKHHYLAPSTESEESSSPSGHLDKTDAHIPHKTNDVWECLPSSLSMLKSAVPSSKQTGVNESQSVQPSIPFPFNVEFRAENFIAGSVDERRLALDGRDQTSGEFDVIVVFSVTKWIHLHFGDRGIRTLFRRVHNLLAPGGKFILEPQSWQSYRKKRRLCDFKQRLSQISLKPHVFDDYLTHDSTRRKTEGISSADIEEAYSEQLPSDDDCDDNDDDNDDNDNDGHNVNASDDIDTRPATRPQMFRLLFVFTPSEDEDRVEQQRDVVHDPQSAFVAKQFNRPVFVYEKCEQTNLKEL